MHASPGKHSYAWLPRKCDYRTNRHMDRQTPDKIIPMCPYALQATQLDKHTNKQILQKSDFAHFLLQVFSTVSNTMVTSLPFSECFYPCPCVRVSCRRFTISDSFVTSLAVSECLPQYHCDCVFYPCQCAPVLEPPANVLQTLTVLLLPSLSRNAYLSITVTACFIHVNVPLC